LNKSNSQILKMKSINRVISKRKAIIPKNKYALSVADFVLPKNSVFGTAAILIIAQNSITLNFFLIY
jgi:hypothetical protein